MARGGARRRGLSRPYRRDVAEALKGSAVHFLAGRQPGHAYSADEMREMGRKIAGLVRQGNYLSQACKAVGIRRDIVYRWKRTAEGRDGEEDCVRPEYRALCEEVVEEIERAAAEVEAELVSDWVAQARGNWQAARDFLARRFPQRWGNSEHRTLQVRQAGQMQLALRWGDEAEAPSAEEESEPGRLTKRN